MDLLLYMIFISVRKFTLMICYPDQPAIRIIFIMRFDPCSIHNTTQSDKRYIVISCYESSG